MKLNKKNSIFVLSFIVIIFLWYFFLKDIFEFNFLKSNLDLLQNFAQENLFLSVFFFFLIYFLSVCFFLPSALILTLLAGAIFDLYLALFIVVLSSNLGACVNFLSAKYLFKKELESRFHKYIDPINKGIKKDGTFYLFSLRLIPIFPFFVINAVFGLLKFPLKKFFLVNVISMLPASFIYINIASNLSQVQNLQNLVSKEIIFSFTLLGFFSLFAKFFVNYLDSKKIYKNYKKPKSFDANVIVIGAGAAGLVASYVGSFLKAKVILFEESKTGGDCLNEGCVPSKKLIALAKENYIFNKAQAKFGKKPVYFPFLDVMEQVKKTIVQIAPNDSVERYEKLGVKVILAKAKILSPYEVLANKKIYTCKKIIIAAGAKPIVPNIKGIENITPLTSKNLWQLKEKPQNLLIVGSGAIGCELSQAFSRLGVDTTLIDNAKRVLVNEDEDVSKIIQKQLELDKVNLYLNYKIKEIHKDNQQKSVTLEQNKKEIIIYFSHILFATGRGATDIKSFCELDLNLEPNKNLKVNRFMQTKYKNIYGAGDVANSLKLTQNASYSASIASFNALFAPLKKIKFNQDLVPRVLFCEPNVASIGKTKNEIERLYKKDKIFVHKFNLKEFDRGIIEGDFGFIKFVCTKKLKILSCSIVAKNASEMIGTFAFLMANDLSLKSLSNSIYPYLTYVEANKLSVGSLRLKLAPKIILKILKKFHQINIKND